MSIELSRPVASFLGASKMNSVSVQNRIPEMGLTVPELYRGRMKKSRFGKILAKEITERYSYFDLSLEQDIIFKPTLKMRDAITPKTKWYDSYY